MEDRLSDQLFNLYFIPDKAIVSLTRLDSVSRVRKVRCMEVVPLVPDVRIAPELSSVLVRDMERKQTASDKTIYVTKFQCLQFENPEPAYSGVVTGTLCGWTHCILLHFCVKKLGLLDILGYIQILLFRQASLFVLGAS
jgi:hypothetical protein